MASQMLRICKVMSNSLRNDVCNSSVSCSLLSKIHIPLLCDARNKTFFISKSADELWKGVTSVSNAGKRRGRAKGLARKRDLNKGQIIGVGKVPMLFPGLNAPVFRGKEMLKQQNLPADPEREEKLAQLRQSQTGKKRIKLSPLERGWTSATMCGRKIGPPNAIGEDTFEDFETWVLENKLVSYMTGNLGRKTRISSFVVTGNGQGLAGFGLAKASVAKTSIVTAKNKAILRLMYIPRYQEHTVLHDFYTQFGNTKIFVRKMNKGYGLICHRAIKCCCEAIGIKDLHAKVEGSTNLQNIVKAFFIGLLQQKSHQQLADEKQLHLVELRAENSDYPEVVASPLKVRKADEVPSDEILDFNRYLMDGKIRLRKKKSVPFYTKFPSYQLHLKKMERMRHYNDTKIRILAEHGKLQSFLTEKYPEASYINRNKKEMNSDE